MIRYLTHRRRILIIIYLYHLEETHRFISLERHWEVHMHSFRMLLHRRTMLLHRVSNLHQCFWQVIFRRRKLISYKYNLYFPISYLFWGVGFSHEVFPSFLGLLRNIFLSFRLYMGDLWPYCQGPQLSKLGFGGGLLVLICHSNLGTKTYSHKRFQKIKHENVIMCSTKWVAALYNQ